MLYLGVKKGINMALIFRKSKKEQKGIEKIDTTALVYALKTIRIDRDELLGINNQAISILNTILNSETTLSQEIATVEEKGENLYASIQIVLEAVDVLTEYTKETSSNINTGLQGINDIIEKITLFTDNTSEILNFIQPFKDYSIKIGSISDIIFSIAEMTENAARNAGIKAYHAGEYGRGFEVIADRMLMLANKTFVLTKKIPTGISKIQEYTEDVITNIGVTEEYAKDIKGNIDKLASSLSNIEDNIDAITVTSDKVKGFVSMQDSNKSDISRLNREAAGLIKKSVASGERLASMVRTQSDIKMMLLHHMNQIDDMIMMFNDFTKDKEPVITNEIKLFDKILNQLINSRNISEQLLGIIDDFIDFNENQLTFIGGYKKNINALEDNERMIETNIQDLEDSISLTIHAVKKFNENILSTSEKIIRVKQQIKDLMSVFDNVSNNLTYIQDTSNELKELSESTKLLSLYASIEAARAGKYQKSLSVIVSQSKELITKAAQASSEINKIIKNMQSVVNNLNDIVNLELHTSTDIAGSIKSGQHISTQITDTINNIKGLIEEIYKALEAQSRVRNDIIGTYSKINKETEKINERTRELHGLLKQDLAKNEDNIEMTQGIKASISDKFSVKRDHEHNRYRMIISNPPQHWVPALVGDASSNYALQHIHSGLVSFGVDTNVLPGVAKYWHINEDATEWIFYLRNNVYFHDNSHLTADDVKATMLRVLQSHNASFINMIKGAEDYINRKNHFVEGIEVLDDYTIKFTLDYPFIPLLSNLAITPLSIIKKEMMNFSDKKMQENPIGCGPYKVKYFNENKLELIANESYYEGEPYIDAIDITFDDDGDTFEMLIADKIDFSQLSGKDYDRTMREKFTNIYTQSIASLDVQYIGFNMKNKNEITMNKKVRQAINYATDKQRYINETMAGAAIAAKGVFPPGLPSFNNSLRGYEFDLNRAKHMMNEAGYPNGINRIFEITCSSSESVKKRVHLLRDMWAQIGVKIKPRPVDWSTLLNDMHAGRTELFMMGWAGDTGEPDNFLYPLFHTDAWGDGGNNTFYSNPEVDDLILKARQTTNPDKRNSIYKKIEESIVEDAPSVFMSHNYTRIGLLNRVKGYFVHPLNNYPLDVTWLDWSRK